MGLKVHAACLFVEVTGGRAAIGPLEVAEAMLAGKPAPRHADGHGAELLVLSVSDPALGAG